MKRLSKVLTKARFTATASTANLHFNASQKSVIVGRADGECGGYIGRVCETLPTRNIFDSSVWFNLGFPNVIGIFGTRGTGKSFNLGVFAECLAGIKQVTTGEFPPPAVVIFDVQNQFWTLSMPPDPKNDKRHLKMLSEWQLLPESIPGLCCWNPAGATSYIPDVRDYQLSPDQLNASDWLMLLEQERYSPMGQAMLELLRQNTNKVPSVLATNASSRGVLSSFQSTTADGLRWRLESIAKTDLIGTSGVNINEFLVPGRVSVVLLRNLNENLRALTVAVMVRLLSTKMTNFHQQYRVARRGKAEYPNETLPQRLCIMMDEAHTIAPRENKTPANEPLIDYVKRGRDSGLSLIFATQQPSAVDDKMMSQVDITLTHALGFETDVQAAVARMPTVKPASYKCGADSLSSPGDLIRSLIPGEAVLAAAGQRPFVIQMRPRLSAHGGDTPN